MATTNESSLGSPAPPDGGGFRQPGQTFADADRTDSDRGRSTLARWKHQMRNGARSHGGILLGCLPRPRAPCHLGLTPRPASCKISPADVFDFDNESLEQRLVERIDPGGETRRLLAELGPLAASGALGAQGAELQETAANMHDLVVTAAQAIRVFARHGWAPSGTEPVEGYREALGVLEESGLEAAEARLADVWTDRPWTVHVGRFAGFASRHQPLNELFHARARLVRLAVEHHAAGRYDASIPILLAQIEGLCIDATGKQFFTRRGDLRADFVDDATLAGLDEGLPTARRWWEEPDQGTGRHGTPHRHPVLHGRELAYDTRVNSTKVLVLLLSVMTWAEPIVNQRAEQLRAARQDAAAGSDDVDGAGRRVDDREFDETRAALRRVQTAQFGRWNNLGRYLGEELEEVLASGFIRDGLPSPPQVRIRCTPTGDAWWAWRCTVTGYVLGIGGLGPRPSEWYFEGPHEPDGPPGSGPGWGDGEFAATSNW